MSLICSDAKFVISGREQPYLLLRVLPLPKMKRIQVIF